MCVSLRDVQRRYDSSPKGRARFRRYNLSSKGRARSRRYKASSKGRERDKKFCATNHYHEKNRERMRGIRNPLAQFKRTIGLTKFREITK